MIDFNGDYLTTDEAIAEAMAVHFSKSFKPSNVLYEARSPSACILFNELQITDDIIRQIVDKFDVKKSESPTRLPNKVIKHCRYHLYKPIRELMMKIKTTVVIPKCNKISKVTPILKANKPKNQIASHRPISVGSNVNKLMENCCFSTWKRLWYIIR